MSCLRVQEGRWDDSPCNLTLASICKKPGTKNDGKPQHQDCKQVWIFFSLCIQRHIQYFTLPLMCAVYDLFWTRYNFFLSSLYIARFYSTKTLFRSPAAFLCCYPSCWQSAVLLGAELLFLVFQPFHHLWPLFPELSFISHPSTGPIVRPQSVTVIYITLLRLRSGRQTHTIPNQPCFPKKLHSCTTKLTSQLHFQGNTFSPG